MAKVRLNFVFEVEPTEESIARHKRSLRLRAAAAIEEALGDVQEVSWGSPDIAEDQVWTDLRTGIDWTVTYVGSDFVRFFRIQDGHYASGSEPFSHFEYFFEKVEGE